MFDQHLSSLNIEKFMDMTVVNVKTNILLSLYR